MKSFFNILQTIIKSDVIRYPGETNKFIPLTLNTTSDMYTNYSVYSFICKIHKEFNAIKNCEENQENGQNSIHCFLTKVLQRIQDNWYKKMNSKLQDQILF